MQRESLQKRLAALPRMGEDSEELTITNSSKCCKDKIKAH
jgi:hypothetical protein